MDHVVGRGDQADFFVHWYDQWVIDFQQIVIDALTRFGTTLVGQFTMPGIDGGNEPDTGTLTG